MRAVPIIYTPSTYQNGMMTTTLSHSSLIEILNLHDNIFIMSYDIPEKTITIRLRSNDEDYANYLATEPIIGYILLRELNDPPLNFKQIVSPKDSARREGTQWVDMGM